MPLKTALAAFVVVIVTAGLSRAQSSTTVDWFNSSGTVLRDAAGVPLSQGNPQANSDGALVQLGYFDQATEANNFAGTWIPITGAAGGTRTTIGDSADLSGAGAGRVQFNTFFILGRADVPVYDPEFDAGSYTTQSSVTISSTTPPENQILAIRFYSSSDGATGTYNTVSADAWRWVPPTSAGPVIALNLATASLEFQDSANPYKATIPVSGVPPTPTPTPTATPDPTPTPTATPTPSVSPTATPTPAPTASPSPTASPTPLPTASPTPSASPSPSASPASHLANISTRLRVGTGDNVLIAGFILQGSGEKRLIVRGIGPSLSGLSGRLMDPVLELFDNGGNELAENDRWQDDVNAAETQESTLAPTDPNEPALLRRLLSADTTLYTAVVSGKNGTTGIGLVEVYDLDQNGPVQIVNIATRGFVQIEDDAMIGGVIVTGEAEADLVIRAIGPSLTVNNKLADPVLGLFNNDGDLIFANDDWKANQQEAIESTGLQPQNENESAIRISLKPGNYTAIVRGKNDSTGVAVVEVYKLSR